MSFSESLEEIVAKNRNQLMGIHHTWKRLKLSEIAAIVNGLPFDSILFTSDSTAGEPLIRIPDVLRSATETFVSGEYDSAYLVTYGDLLVGMDVNTQHA